MHARSKFIAVIALACVGLGAASALAGATGYAVASIDYPERAPRAEQLADLKAAIVFLRGRAAQYGLDGAHIAVMGHDVGGQLAALAGTTADTAALNPGGAARVQA